MIYEKVLFSFDNPNDIHEYARAVRKLSEYEALGRIAEVTPCVGSYEGVLEPSFMMLAKDFEKHIRELWFMDGQSTIIRVPGDVRQPCVLEYLHTGHRLSVGPMREVRDHMYYDSWTYVLETGKYFTTQEK
jgi:hypothetical protein